MERDLASMAAALFAGTRSIHRLGPRVGHVLAVAAGNRERSRSASRPDSLAVDVERDRLSDGDRALEQGVLALLAPANAEAGRFAALPAGKQNQARVLAALLRVGEVLADSGGYPTSLDSIVVGHGAVSLRLGGPGAREAARRARRASSLWRLAFQHRLSIAVAPPTAADLEQIATIPLTPEMPVVALIQRAVAAEWLSLERALTACSTDSPEAPVEGLRVVSRLSQLLAALRPVLKRRSVDQLREALAAARKRMALAADRLAASADVARYRDDKPPDTGDSLTSLLETAASASQAALAALGMWANERETANLLSDLRRCASDVPVRRGETPTIGATAPGLLQKAANGLMRRQAAYIASEADTRRRLARAGVRLRVLLDAVAPSGLYDQAARELAYDLDRMTERLEALQRLEAVEAGVAEYLDAWAERQARRKAPQLHGAEAVLVYRQARRAERTHELRALADDLKALRGQRLKRRIGELLQGSPGAEAKPGK